MGKIDRRAAPEKRIDGAALVTNKSAGGQESRVSKWTRIWNPDRTYEQLCATLDGELNEVIELAFGVIVAAIVHC